MATQCDRATVVLSLHFWVLGCWRRHSPKWQSLEDAILAKEIRSFHWNDLYAPSKIEVNKAHKDQENAAPLRPPLGNLRVSPSRHFTRRYAQLEDNSVGAWTGGHEPTVHVIGYSLGGFAAAVGIHMSWPF